MQRLHQLQILLKSERDRAAALEKKLEGDGVDIKRVALSPSRFPAHVEFPPSAAERRAAEEQERLAAEEAARRRRVAERAKKKRVQKRQAWKKDAASTSPAKSPTRATRSPVKPAVKGLKFSDVPRFKDDGPSFAPGPGDYAPKPSSFPDSDAAVRSRRKKRRQAAEAAAAARTSPKRSSRSSIGSSDSSSTAVRSVTTTSPLKRAGEARTTRKDVALATAETELRHARREVFSLRKKLAEAETRHEVQMRSSSASADELRRQVRNVEADLRRTKAELETRKTFVNELMPSVKALEEVMLSLAPRFAASDVHHQFTLLEEAAAPLFQAQLRYQAAVDRRAKKRGSIFAAAGSVSHKALVDALSTLSRKHSAVALPSGLKDLSLPGHVAAGARVDGDSAELTDERMTKMVFDYYCCSGEHSARTTLSRQKFLRLLSDCEVIDSDFPVLDAELVFKMAVRSGKRAARKFTTRMTFDDFMVAIAEIGARKYADRDEEQQLREIVDEIVLLYDDLAAKVTMVEPELTAVFSEYESPLQRLYAQYAGKEIALGKTGTTPTWDSVLRSKVQMDVEGFIAFASDLHITPYLLTQAAATSLFHDLAEPAGVGGEAQLSFVNFLGCLAALAQSGFSSAEQAQRYPTQKARLYRLLYHMDTSGTLFPNVARFVADEDKEEEAAGVIPSAAVGRKAPTARTRATMLL
eukprot:PLAT13998.2.p1 GENE.PLAT13998.2~~PLAT13998.2.p1  ORF type:complete len:703 (-),score=250.46 PLAT13998.2:1012-3099(-)